MVTERNLVERVATMEGRWSETIPEIQRRLGVLEANDAEILQEVTTTKTEVQQIKEMLKNNGFGKKNSKRDPQTDIAVLKLETRFTRWMTGIVIAIVSLVIAAIVLLT